MGRAHPVSTRPSVPGPRSTRPVSPDLSKTSPGSAAYAALVPPGKVLSSRDVRAPWTQPFPDVVKQIEGGDRALTRAICYRSE